MSSPTPILPDDKSAAKASRKLLDYAVENPLKTLSSAVSILGGLLLLMFLTDIEFLPDVDLAGVASILYAVALLGLTLVVVMVVLLVVPAFVMRGVRDMSGRSSKQAANPVVHTGYPAEPMSGGTRPRRCAEIVPWIVTFAVWAAGLIWQLTEADQKGIREFAAVACMACLLGAVTWVCREAIAVRGEPAAKRRAFSVAWIAADAIVALLCFAMPVFVILQLMAVGDLGHESVSPSILATLVLLLMVSAVVACVLSTPHVQVSLGVVFAFALALFALVATQTHSVTAVPHTIVRKLRLGDIEFARIGVTAAGCRQINAALGAGACPTEGEADTVTPLCPVRIRSRVGQQLVLEFGEVDWREQSDETKQWRAAWVAPKQRMRRVILDKAQMTSWQPLRPVVDEEGPVPKAKEAGKDVTLWRSSAVGGEARLQRLCDVRLEAPAALPPVSASSPASAPLPPKAPRG
jgi:hypothetical protein